MKLKPLTLDEHNQTGILLSQISQDLEELGTRLMLAYPTDRNGYQYIKQLLFTLIELRSVLKWNLREENPSSSEDLSRVYTRGPKRNPLPK